MNWQVVIAVAIVLIALGYSAWKLYRQFTGKDSPQCPFCKNDDAGCPTGRSGSEDNLKASEDEDENVVKHQNNTAASGSSPGDEESSEQN